MGKPINYRREFRYCWHVKYNLSHTCTRSGPSSSNCPTDSLGALVHPLQCTLAASSWAQTSVSVSAPTERKADGRGAPWNHWYRKVSLLSPRITIEYFSGAKDYLSWLYFFHRSFSFVGYMCNNVLLLVIKLVQYLNQVHFISVFKWMPLQRNYLL